MKLLKIGFFIVAFLLVAVAKSQVIYITTVKENADKKIFITDNPADADVIVFKSEWKSDAQKDSGIWFFTDWKNEADMQVYVTEWRSEADIVICYTPHKEEAVWRKR